MQVIKLLRPVQDSYIAVRTTAIPVSGSRVIKSDTGVEIEEGFQKFIIPRRMLDTDWKVQWRDIFFRVEGIVPSNTPYKIILICSVEERIINIVPRTVCNSLLEYQPDIFVSYNNIEPYYCGEATY